MSLGFPPIIAVPGVFSPELCERLITGFQTHGGANNPPAEGMAPYDPAHRLRFDWHFKESDPRLAMDCAKAIGEHILPPVWEAFQFQVSKVERFMVGCYSEDRGGHFAPHVDNDGVPVAHRRFALSINLNGGYSGADLYFPDYGSSRYRLDPGEALVFSCSLQHGVTPITSGARYAFLSFLF